MALTSKIVAYDTNWPGKFAKEQAQIAAQLGDLCLAVHHVGSTAIPGIKAKPEIDILIVVASLDAIDAVNAGMAALGYDVRGDDPSPGRHYYSKNSGATRTHKAHVITPSHPDARRLIAFRDYLRDHPEDARAYAELKLELQAANTAGMAEYVAGKGAFVEGIVARALDEGYGP